MSHPMSCQRCNQPHDRCAAHNRSGDPCGSHPIAGSDKCRLHLGRPLAEVKAEHAAAQAAATLGLPADIDPHDALLEEVHRTAGHVRWLAATIAELEPRNVVHGVTKTVQRADGNRDVTAEAKPSVWLTLYQQERRHLVVACKACIDAGIDERRVELAEEQGRIIVGVLTAALEDLGVDVTDDVAATVGRHLRAVS